MRPLNAASIVLNIKPPCIFLEVILLETPLCASMIQYQHYSKSVRLAPGLTFLAITGIQNVKSLSQSRYRRLGARSTENSPETNKANKGTLVYDEVSI